MTLFLFLKGQYQHLPISTWSKGKNLRCAVQILVDWLMAGMLWEILNTLHYLLCNFFCSFFEDLKTDVLMTSLFQKTVQRYRGNFNRYRVILKKVSFGVLRIILVFKGEKKFSYFTTFLLGHLHSFLHSFLKFMKNLLKNNLCHDSKQCNDLDRSRSRIRVRLINEYGLTV